MLTRDPVEKKEKLFNPSVTAKRTYAEKNILLRIEQFVLLEQTTFATQ